MDSQFLRYQCPQCQKTVRVDESVMGKQVDCPHCGRPFLAETPVARPLGPSEGEEDEAVASVKLEADDESDLEIVHPVIFRRHFFGTILSALMVLGGVGLIVFGALTAALLVPPGLYFLIGGSVLALLGGFFLLKWWIIAKTHKLTLTTERCIYRSGIFQRFTSEVRHDDVRNIKLDQNFMERILKFGDIAISSSGQDEMEIVIRNIPHPQKIVDLIRRQQ